MNRWHYLFVAILVLGGAWLWATRVPADAAAGLEPQPAVRHPAPDFTLTRLGSDETVSLSDLQGRPVVLNFWATWCGPCRREMPVLQATAERYGGDLLVVGVDQGERADVVAAFLDEFGITYPVLLDSSMEVGNRYNILGLPTTFFIDREGVIRRVYAGEINSAILAESIRTILP